MTYREELQELIRSIWKVYETTGGLRDCAAENEKQPFNTARGKLHDAAISLSRLDDSLPRERATMQL